ncbi:hypothetical protein PR048_033241 [Dryococelus australis]|uniref:Uncharacterized protein n=1 Tax=Dryococelus australis TaxID=614101 RepID=A0ABQ9FZR3_9NEOP|nr:hypothetical protein PR048_033241 [Dryococelus australis]
MQLLGGFSRGSLVSPPLHSGTAPCPSRFTHVGGSQDLVTARLPPRRTGFNPRPGDRIFASAGRCRWSAGFLRDLPFPPPLHSGTDPYSLQSPSLLRAAQISSLAHVEDTWSNARTRRQMKYDELRHMERDLCSYSAMPSYRRRITQHSVIAGLVEGIPACWGSSIACLDCGNRLS